MGGQVGSTPRCHGRSLGSNKKNVSKNRNMHDILKADRHKIYFMIICLSNGLKKHSLHAKFTVPRRNRSIRLLSAALKTGPRRSLYPAQSMYIRFRECISGSENAYLVYYSENVVFFKSISFMLVLHCY
jgi:hypothetical protein